jgi:hypothetical protein
LKYHQYIMRTTVNIDDPILEELKKIQQKERRPLGRLISDLLAQALCDRKSGRSSVKPAAWFSKPMGARFDLADREAVYTAMDRGGESKKVTERE